MIQINQGILHILDCFGGTDTLSQVEMDLEDLTWVRFLKKQIEKGFQSTKTKKSELREDRLFTQRLLALKNSDITFIEYSNEMAKQAFDLYMKADDLKTIDFVVVDFDYDGEAYLGLLFFNHKFYYTHQVITMNGRIKNEIVMNHGLLPQSMDAYIFIHIHSLDVMMHEPVISVETQEVKLLETYFIECKSYLSLKESYKAIMESVEQTAIGFGNHPTFALSQAKQKIHSDLEMHHEFTPANILKEVFENENQSNHAIQMIQLKDVPDIIEADSKLLKKSELTQKIETDNGIIIQVPIEYVNDSEFFEMIEENGDIVIKIKGIQSIKNK